MTVKVPGGPPETPTSFSCHVPVPPCLSRFVILEGPLAALSSWPSCLDSAALRRSSSLTQALTAQNLALKIRTEDAQGT